MLKASFLGFGMRDLGQGLTICELSNSVLNALVEIEIEILVSAQGPLVLVLSRATHV